MRAKIFGGLLIALALLASVPSAFAALNAYLYVKGEKAGQIEGSVTQKGREGAIMVIAYGHNISAPIDAASGLPTGKVKHEVLTITKEIDKSTPTLYSLLVSNEKITEFKLEFWQPSASGKEVQHFTIRLTNAHITSIKSVMMNNKYPENMQHKEREEISFSYDKITWTWMDGGITTTAEW
jgi:type VI secretion system secreted protein Hcp